MKLSTTKLLTLVDRFYRIAAKLQLEGPGFPQDPNFTGISNQPDYKAVSMEVPDADQFYPKDLPSGVLSKTKPQEYTYPALIGRMADRLAIESKKFYNDVLSWAVNSKNEYKYDIKLYKNAINVINSIGHLAEDIGAKANVGLKEEESKKFLSYLEKYFKFLGESRALFVGLKSFNIVYEGIYHLTNTITESIGSMQRHDISSGNIYDMFAKQDSEEDSREQLIDEDPKDTEKDSDATQSLSFDVKPMRF